MNHISAFTVYRTMDPTRFAFPVAQAIAELSDQEIIDSVHVTQGAADQLYLRRVALLLPQILAKADLEHDELNFDFSDLKVRDDTAVLAGHSQGAGIIPLAMAMDPVFDNGYLSGAASHAYFQATHRGSIRSFIPVLLPGFVQSEVDYFHPLIQVLQMMHDPADSVNYVPYMESENMLQAAGYQDGCVPREASAALGLALARKGLIQPAEPLSREASFFDPDGILNLPEVSFPLTQSNLDSGGIGLFLELGSGHTLGGINQTLHQAMLRITGAVRDQEISAPRFSSSGTGCDVRYEQGYDPGMRIGL